MNCGQKRKCTLPGHRTRVGPANQSSEGDSAYEIREDALVAFRGNTFQRLTLNQIDHRHERRV